MRSVRHLATGGVPLAVGVAAGWASLQLPLGSLTQPGPGLWPLVVSTGLIGSAALVLAAPEGEHEPFSRQSLPIVAALGGLVLFTALFAQLGFVLPAALLLAAWLRYISKESWKVTAAVTLTAVAVLYVFFVLVLDVPFPFDLVTGR
jgi:putative tricarboxylic transport membrane protein